MEIQQYNLLKLQYAKQNSELQEIKKRFSNDSKYFFNIRRNITIVYNQNIIYIIHKEYLKLVQLGKIYVITDLAYNYQKNVLVFMTAQGILYLHFINSKTVIQIKKDYKNIYLLDWIYSVPTIANFFICEERGIHLYRLQEEKKTLKQVKHISGKVHCFLYEPMSQLLIAFPYGDCDVACTYIFQNVRAKNWFRGAQIDIILQDDQGIINQIKKNKSFGLEGSRINKQIFVKQKNEDYVIDILIIHKTPYFIFYYSNEGKLKMTPMLQNSDRKEITIKLPSDAVTSFNVVDNMLVVHLKNEKITFIYDITNDGFQTLVSPYPLFHQKQNDTAKIYNSQFVGKRVLMPDGQICKWKINLHVIFHYLKNQMHIFDFLNHRSNSKMEIIKWLRNNLFIIKHINLSKIWKSLFLKMQFGNYDQSELVSILQLYSNIFFILSIDELCNKEALINIIIQCIRQAIEYHIKLPQQLQMLVVQLLLYTQKYQMLTYLCHHDLFKECQEHIAQLVYKKSQEEQDNQLLTLSLDIAHLVSPPIVVLTMIMKSQRTKEAKRYIKLYYQKIEVLDMLQVAKYIKNISIKRDYIQFIRFFIKQKFPALNNFYIDQVQKNYLNER